LINSKDWRIPADSKPYKKVMTEPATTSASSSHQNDERSALWAATLETWCHQLLFARRVYPKETFCSTRFLGIQCKVNRHPGVVSYIFETVQVAVPALLNGVANELSLVILHAGEELENFSLFFSISGLESNLQLLEKEVRNLILSALSLDGQFSTQHSKDLTFKIMLHIPEENQSCGELNQALTQGTWFCPSTEGSRAEQKRRPLHDMSLSTGEVHFAMNLGETKEK
jgi:hypothetical protein